MPEGAQFFNGGENDIVPRSPGEDVDYSEVGGTEEVLKLWEMQPLMELIFLDLELIHLLISLFRATVDKIITCSSDKTDVSPWSLHLDLFSP